MYAAHFGLTEAPFSITPDPRYLYLSDRHREALAHLLYGIGVGGGFVQLTGEVGTGKTTLCRALMEQAPTHVDVALVLNPRLTAPELLATVCDELRIPYAKDTRSLKVLVDALSAHLLEAHRAGRRTVLIIDEAQNLAPEVLEQVRLLTNLETATQKLLQVILIGQPELIALLQRDGLRQLAQRVTARYHLEPLSEPDTRAYVRHRLSVAGGRQVVFSEAALRMVHRLSRGVPRLINVVCDRALLGAYAHDRDRVDAGTARRAAREVFGRGALPGTRRARWWGVALAACVLALAGLLAWSARTPGDRRSETGPAAGRAAPAGRLPGDAATVASLLSATAASPGHPATAPAPGDGGTAGGAIPEASAGATSQPSALVALLADPAVPKDRWTALAALSARWGLRGETLRGPLICDSLREAGLECLFRAGNWSRLRRFNLPAVIKLTTPTGEQHYAAVSALTADHATLDFGPRRVTLPLHQIEPLWDGQFIMLWRPAPVRRTAVAPGARGRDVEWLRHEMDALDGRATTAPDPAVYDEVLRARVIAFQRSRALVADGVVNEETLAQLAIARGGPGVPALSGLLHAR